MSSFPADWALVRFGDYFDIVRGASPRPKGDPKYFGGSIPWISIRDINAEPGKYLTRTSEGVTAAGAEKSRLLPIGALILSNSASVCIPKILSIAGCIHDGFVTFPGIEQSSDVRYFYYLFDWMRPRVIEKHRQGVTQVNLNTGIIGDFHVPIPPRPLQTRIADKLDTVLARVDTCRDRLARVAPLLKRFRQSVLAAATSGWLTEEWRVERRIILLESWRSTSIGEIARVVRGASPRPAGDPRYFGGECPWITVGELTKDDGKFLRSTSTFVTLEGRDKSRFIEAESLLLTNSGATLGVPKITLIGGFINDGSVAILGIDQPLKNFLYWKLKSLTDQLRGLNQGAAQPNLNTGIVKSIDVQLPSTEEQTEIVRRVETLFAFADRIEARLTQARSAAERLTPSLLAKAFRGELVPQDPDDEPAAELLRRLAADRLAGAAASPMRRRTSREAV